jgi:ABC-type nitrate/sulfonate/bicarbonate transport system substrate-binding protein
LGQRALTLVEPVASRDEQLKVGTFTPSLLIDLARSSGAFRRKGLDVVESLVASSPAQFTSLEAGELDVVFTSPDNVLAYQFLSDNPLRRNIPLQILCGIDRGLGLSLWKGPGIASAEQLRGRILGVDVPQSGFAFVAYALLERAGLRPGDYELESLGSTPRRTDALIAGACAVTILNAGNELRAAGNGCTFVSPVADLGPYYGTVLATLADRGGDVNEVNQRFAGALLATAGEIISGARKADVVEAATRLLHLSDAEARDHYDCLLDPVTGFVASGRVDRASVATLVELRRAYAPTPELDRIMDALDTVVLDGVLE